MQRNGEKYLRAVEFKRVSSEQITKALDGKLADQTSLITDKHPFYKLSANENLKIKHRSISAKEHLDVDDKGVHLQKVNNTHAHDGTCNVGYIANGEWLEYTVGIALSGTYTIEARVAASNSAGGTYEISFSNGGTTGNVSFAGTNGWQSWTTVTTTGVSLNAGQQVMRVDMKSSGFNLNYINVVAEASGGESFTNHSATAESWSNGSFEGDNGFTWSYNQGQTRTSIMTGKSARIKAGGWGRLETTIPNGIESLQFDLLGEGSPVNRSKIEVFVDNVSYGVFEATSATIPTTIIIEDINAQGQVPLKFASVDFTVNMDNISWTGGMSNPSTTTSSSALSNDQSFTSGMPFDQVSRLQEVKIYPNPARERMTIDLGTMENVSMEIVDITGKKVIERQAVRGSIELDLPKGIYFISLKNGSELFTSKVIFE